MGDVREILFDRRQRAENLIFIRLGVYRSLWLSDVIERGSPTVQWDGIQTRNIGTSNTRRGASAGSNSTSYQAASFGASP